MYEALIVYAVSIVAALVLGLLVWSLNPRAIQKRGIPFLVLVGIIPAFNAILILFLALVAIFLLLDRSPPAGDSGRVES